MLEAGDLNKLFRDCMPLFIALGDEVRLSIIGVLAGSGLYDDHETDIAVSLNGYRPSGVPGMNVKEITEQTNLSRPAISHHLKILKDAGLVNVRREGTSNYYYLTIADSTKELRRSCIHQKPHEYRQFMNIMVFSRYTIFYKRTIDSF